MPIDPLELAKDIEDQAQVMRTWISRDRLANSDLLLPIDTVLSNLRGIAANVRCLTDPVPLPPPEVPDRNAIAHAIRRGRNKAIGEECSLDNKDYVSADAVIALLLGENEDTEEAGG